MDLSRIKSYGSAKSGKAWQVVRPLRSVLWRLISPYFQGMVDWTEERFRSEAAGHHGEGMGTFSTRYPGIFKDITAIQHRLAGIEEALARIEANQRAPASTAPGAVVQPSTEPGNPPG